VHSLQVIENFLLNGHGTHLFCKFPSDFCGMIETSGMHSALKTTHKLCTRASVKCDQILENGSKLHIYILLYFTLSYGQHFVLQGNL